MPKRQTLAAPATIEGVGLHLGEHARVRLLPASPRAGIVFTRADAGGVEIPALLAHVVRSAYATVLEREGVRISTVEHVLAAVHALQVDDLRIEVDGPEVPILDGSARPFVDAILEVGRVESTVEREYVTLVRPVVVSEAEKRISAHPARDYRVTYAIDFDHPMLGYQELSVSLWKESDFVEKLAPARTFTFDTEVDRLRQSGLARGGSLDNAVVVAHSGVLNSMLRFPDEFVRHKMLDLTGDLCLLGHPLRAHVVAYRAGHELHVKLVRRLLERRDAWYLAPWSGEPTEARALARG